jgi:hypothetical protein
MLSFLLFVRAVLFGKHPTKARAPKTLEVGLEYARPYRACQVRNRRRDLRDISCILPFGGTVAQRFGKEKTLAVLFGGTYDSNGRGHDLAHALGK